MSLKLYVPVAYGVANNAMGFKRRTSILSKKAFIVETDAKSYSFGNEFYDLVTNTSSTSGVSLETDDLVMKVIELEVQ